MVALSSFHWPNERAFAWLYTTTGIVAFSLFALLISEYVFRFSLSLAPFVGYGFYWMILTGMFMLLVWWPWASMRGDSLRLFVQAFVVGVIVGLAVATLKVVLYSELWTMFNLVAEPVRLGLFGILVSWLVTMASIE